MTENSKKDDLLGMTAEIVCAFVSNNRVGVDELPGLVAAVHGALAGAGAPPPEPEPQPAQQAPAVPVRKSITPDAIICLEDGRRMKTLKRHLSVKYGLTPDQYRAKWGLPDDYPMVAPAYAAMRSDLAKAIGLGGGRKAAGSPSATVTRRRGRPPKAVG